MDILTSGVDMEDKVAQELINENTILRKMVNDKEGFVSHIEVLSLSPVMKIRGVLIAEGVWKGVKYTYEQMKAALSKFKSLAGKVMHERSSDFGDETIGKLTKVVPNDVLRSICFEADITDEKAAKLIRDGVFNAVSIKGGFEKLDTSGTPPVGENYTPIEWSLTGSPVCQNCMIFSADELSRSLSNSDNGENMSENIVNPNDPIKEDPIDWEAFTAELSIKDDMKTWMKECMGDSVKAKEFPNIKQRVAVCASMWRREHKQPDKPPAMSEDEDETPELSNGKIPCPVCGKELSNSSDFKNHWSYIHSGKYGSYSAVKKLAKRLLDDKPFRSNIKRLIVSLDNEQTIPVIPPANIPPTTPPQTPPASTIPANTIPPQVPPQTPPITPPSSIPPIQVPSVPPVVPEVPIIPEPTPEITQKEIETMVNQAIKDGKGPELIALLLTGGKKRNE